MQVRPLSCIVVLLLCTACESQSGADAGLSNDVAAGVAAAPPAPEMSSKAVMAREMPATDVRGTAQAPPPAQVQGSTTAPMIVRNGSASIEVDSLEIAIAAVERMAKDLGGIVGNTSLSSGDEQVRSASIELRIPSSRFDEALQGLRPIGKLESVQSNAQDVGEEFVDITARSTNAKRLEDRLVALLANRAGKLEEVLAVERELARVREDIERYEGRIRYLQARVTTSTFLITVHEKRPLISDNPGENVLAEAFKQAWRNFVAFVAAFIALLGILIPAAILAVPLVTGYRRMQRKRSSKLTDA